MDFDTTLKNYNRTKSEIRSLILRQQELRELCGFPKTGNMDGMPKSHSTTSYIENFVIKLMELEEKQKELETTLFALQNDIYRFLGVIENSNVAENYKIKLVCEYRILFNYGWKKISHCIDRSYSRTRDYYYMGLQIMRGVTLWCLK